MAGRSRSKPEVEALTARNADRHALYEMSVQAPHVVVDFVDRLFSRSGRVRPHVLREDFCGTGFLASTFVRSGKGRRAIGVDLDGKMIGYAERHNRRPLGEAADRLKLVSADVLKTGATADVVASLNFSHFIYKTRGELMRYLRHMRRCVRPGGLALLDLYGGPGAMTPCNDGREFGEFTYYWEQVWYKPDTAEVLNHIHFRFGDGSMMRKAFTYRWRLWTIAELCEALVEAGFEAVEVWYEEEDGFTNRFDPELEAWVSYLVAWR